MEKVLPPCTQILKAQVPNVKCWACWALGQTVQGCYQVYRSELCRMGIAKSQQHRGRSLRCNPQLRVRRHEQSSSRLTMRKKYNKLRKNDGNKGRAREYNHEILWLFRDWKMGFQRPASLHSTCAGSFHLGLCATDLPFRHGSFPANYHPAEV